MRKNVGTLDALLRISFGLFGLALGISHLVKHPYRKLPIFSTLYSAVKVAEGIVRFCPFLALLNMNTLDRKDQDNRKAPYPTAYYARRRIENPPTLQEEREGLL